ncbi:MAG: FAD:protein FMN transferase [Bacteroidales bacterium]
MQKEKPGVFYRNFFAMGTRFDLVIPFMDDEKGNELFNEIRKEVQRLEIMLSRFHEGGSTWLLNKNASTGPVKVDQELKDIILLCREYHAKTKGYFDITIGESTTKERKSNIDDILINRKENTIQFISHSLSLDFGGIGKGYALDCIKLVLAEQGIDSAFISFGESSVLGWGSHPHGDSWNMAVENIFVPGESVYIFHLTNSSVSVSGNHPKYLKRKGVEGHIYNPFTREVVKGNRLVAVQSHSASDAEVLSTALISANNLAIHNIIANFAGCYCVEIVFGDDNRNVDITVLNTI